MSVFDVLHLLQPNENTNGPNHHYRHHHYGDKKCLFLFFHDFPLSPCLLLLLSPLTFLIRDLGPGNGGLVTPTELFGSLGEKADYYTPVCQGCPWVLLAEAKDLISVSLGFCHLYPLLLAGYKMLSTFLCQASFGEDLDKPLILNVSLAKELGRVFPTSSHIPRDEDALANQHQINDQIHNILLF